MYITRHLEAAVRHGSDNFPVLLLSGSRQVGKSTVLRQLGDSEREYVTLDDPFQRDMAQNRPQDFLAGHRPPVTIDEIQYAPQLFPYLKMAVDDDCADGAYWITGSQVFPLMKGVTESLVGRVAVLRLGGLTGCEEYGLAPHELATNHGELAQSLPEPVVRQKLSQSRFGRILRGQFPRSVTHPDLSAELFFSSYIQTWLERDVYQQLNLRSESTFLQFVRLLAARTGQELNKGALAAALQVDTKTVTSWLSVLESSGVVYLLPAWARNLGKRVVKRPKVYFLDTGLVCYLCGITSEAALQNSPISGAIYETWVVGEILRSWWNQGLREHVFYYRDQSQKEIDLILEIGETILPLEIKVSSTPHAPFKNFEVLAPVAARVPYWGCICTVDAPTSVGDNAWLLPDTCL